MAVVSAVVLTTGDAAVLDEAIDMENLRYSKIVYECFQFYK